MKDVLRQLLLEVVVVCSVMCVGAVIAVRSLLAARRQQPGQSSGTTSARQPAFAKARAVIGHVITAWRSKVAPVSWYVVVVVLTWLAMAPVMYDPRLSILDCANVYRSYADIRVLKPSTWLNVDNDPTSVRPGEVLIHVPAAVTPGAAAQYWYLASVLSGTMLMMFFLVHRASGSRALGLAAVAACLTAPSFVENYYTLGKCEPFMIAGAMGVLWVLYMALYRQPVVCGRWWFVIGPMGVFSALLATTVKETAVAFAGMYPVIVVLLMWAAPVTWKHAMRRTAWLSLVVALGFAVMIIEYCALPAHYDQGGTAVYSLSLANLVRGAKYIIGHYLLTTPSVLVALVMLLLAVWRDGRRMVHGEERVGMALELVFLVMWLGYAAIYVPWSSPQVRYFLPGAFAIRAAIMVIMGLALASARNAPRGWYRWVQRGLAAIVFVLMVSHAGFTMLVGHISEGRARQRFDVAYDEMFKYIAAHTPRGGTAYFMYDRDHEESRYNTRFGMPLFYGRADINCVFPQSSAAFDKPGLVVVAHSAASYCPNRMPVHAEAAALFNQRIAAEKVFVERTNIVVDVPLWYVDARAYRGFQYRARCGVPAFWELRRGRFLFGWTIYAFTPTAQRPNLIRNHAFKNGMEHWALWGAGCDTANTVVVADAAVRIVNPSGELRGVKQHVAAVMVSGGVYRLSAAARLVGAPDTEKILGGRVAVHLPPQPEHDITWLSQRDHWHQQECVFTNIVTGNPIVLVHMGYGRVAATAEFSDVVLEQLAP